jgi:hypothetical protein
MKHTVLVCAPSVGALLALGYGNKRRTRKKTGNVNFAEGTVIVMLVVEPDYIPNS